MDALVDMLQTLRLNGGLFLEAEFTAPWCIRAQVGPEDCAPHAPVPRHIIAYHYVFGGEMLLQVADAAPVRVGPGQIAVLPRNDVHRMGSSLTRRAVTADSLIEPGTAGALARIVHGGGGAPTRLYCGFLGSEMAHHPVLSILPAVLVLDATDAASGDWVERSLRFAVETRAAGGVLSPHLVGRVAELLFLDSVRRYVERLEGDRGWNPDLLDARVAKVLALLHGDLRQRWTSDRLAERAGLSRSAFAERFTRAVGEPPMRYLARLRLERAAERIANGSDPVARIAYEVGYESESAFTRAFTRAYGAAPTTWRRNARQQDG
ncbi:MAG: AraC family transcriptional regulator [Pseudomonadales bacterium]|nr:AraC family transcriptional regulator [Pseudomonadales bacterium]